MCTIITKHCNNQFWRGELWRDGELLWWTAFEETSECVTTKLRDWASHLSTQEITMVTCSFVNTTEKCTRCDKRAKEGFLVGNAEFVCSEKCGEEIVRGFSTQEIKPATLS